MSILKIPVSSDDHIQGKDQSPITLVEYGDYQCPYCAMAHPIVKQIQSYFEDQLRFVFRHFPLSEIHPLAEPAAEAAEYAAENERFWEMHDLIFENQPSLGLPLLLQLGEKLRLSTADLELAITHKKYSPKIQKDFQGGIRSGVNGTPTFFINDHRYNGPIGFEALVAGINSLLVGQ